MLCFVKIDNMWMERFGNYDSLVGFSGYHLIRIQNLDIDLFDMCHIIYLLKLWHAFRYCLKALTKWDDYFKMI